MSVARDERRPVRALRSAVLADDSAALAGHPVPPATPGPTAARVAPDHPSLGRRPVGAPAPHAPRLLAIRALGDDLVAIRDRGAVIGFVERAGDEFVTLRGDRYDLAVDVARSPTWEAASAALARFVDGVPEGGAIRP